MPAKPSDLSKTSTLQDPLATALTQLHQTVERSRKDGDDHLSLGEILHAVGAEGPSLAAALLTLPFLQPIPLLGLSTPLGFTVALLGFGLFLEREIKLPHRISNAKLPSSSVLKTSEYLLKFETKLKPYLKSDSTFESRHHRRLLGLAIAIHGFLLALPLPVPFSNAFPAWMCFVGAMTILFSSWRLYWFSIMLIAANGVFWTILVIGTIKGSSKVASFLGSWLGDFL